MKMSKRIALQVLSLLLALGLFAYLVTRSDNVTHAQSNGFDRTQYANDTPVGALQDQLPETREGHVMIEARDTPTAKVYAQILGNQNDRAANPQQRAAAQAAARSQMARISGAQHRVLAQLNSAGRNARVLYSVQTAYNGIAAKIDASILPQLRANADVRAVHRLPIHYIDNSTSVPFINAVNAWAVTGANAGQGVKIAIIDTGVDYTHANFGGPGTVAAYNGNNRNIIEPGTFPTAKVVGGKDFAGDAYTGANTPVPDPDPLDCNGHGSHVAGTAAGLGVNGDGTTFLGPYDNTTPFSSFLIGPGVAPRADIYALKIFGCTGSTGLTTQAINYAVDPNNDGDPSDHLDVINMSLGSNFGTATDSSAGASSNAALVGVIVVAAAGNGGDTHYIVSSPATSTRAIAVSNIVDNGVQNAVLQVNSPGARQHCQRVSTRWSQPQRTSQATSNSPTMVRRIRFRVRRPALSAPPLTDARRFRPGSLRDNWRSSIVAVVAVSSSRSKTHRTPEPLASSLPTTSAARFQWAASIRRSRSSRCRSRKPTATGS